MLKKLEFDIKQIKLHLHKLGFPLRLKTLSHNNQIVAINSHLQEILHILMNRSDNNTLFENVSLLTGIITANYVTINTLEQACATTKSVLKYIEQYLKP